MFWLSNQRGAKALFCLALLFAGGPLQAAWSTDPTAPTPLVTADYRQYDPRLIVTEGGFIATWNDLRRENTHTDVYAQKFNIIGDMLWPANGRVVAAGPENALESAIQTSCGLTPDGAGGAIAAWNDNTQGYATNILSDAIVAWGDPGVQIQSEDTAVPMLENYSFTTMWDVTVADSEGGAFIITRGSQLGRFDSLGRLRTEWFHDAGDTQPTDNNLRLVPTVETDGRDGVIVVWPRGSTAYGDGIFARKMIDSETAYPVGTDAFSDAWGRLPIYDPQDFTINACRLQAVPDGAGGVITAWLDDRIRIDTTRYYRIYAQRVDAGGNLLWTTDGVEVSGDVLHYTCYWWMEMHAVADGEGGVVIAWNESNGNNSSIFRAQRLDSEGDALWAPGGVIIDTDISGSAAVLGVVRGRDGNFMTLLSYPRIVNIRPGALMTQKLNGATGESMWGEGQLAFEGCFSNYESNAVIVSDGQAGAIIAFEACDNNIYANRNPEWFAGHDLIGFWRPSNYRFYLDMNGNYRWDDNIDLIAKFGVPYDIPVTGDWNGDGVDDVGVWRSSTHRFLLDMNGDHTLDKDVDITTSFGTSSDLPLAGDWNGDGIDEIGFYRPSTYRFYLDMNGNYRWDDDADLIVKFGVSGDIPVTGDWNGDGIDDVGVWRPTTHRFILDSDGSYMLERGVDIIANFGVLGDLPLAGDWNGDGVDEIGVWRPSTHRFLLDANRSYALERDDADIIANFGTYTDLPVTGKW